jgi:hypothetical protein
MGEQIKTSLQSRDPAVNPKPRVGAVSGAILAGVAGGIAGAGGAVFKGAVGAALCSLAAAY